MAQVNTSHGSQWTTRQGVVSLDNDGSGEHITRVTVDHGRGVVSPMTMMVQVNTSDGSQWTMAGRVVFPLIMMAEVCKSHGSRWITAGVSG